MKPEFTKKPEFMQLAAEQKQNDPPLFAELLFFYLLHLVSALAAGVLISIPMVAWLFSGGRGQELLAVSGDSIAMLETFFTLLGEVPDWLSALMLASNSLLGVAAILYCKFYEKRGLRSMGLVRGHALRNYALGALFGAGSFLAVLGITAAFGGVSIGSMQPLEGLWPTLLMMLLTFVLQSAGEELLVRGYLMVSLSKRYRMALCIFVSSLVFAFLHVSNPGIQFLAFGNILLVGVVLGLYILLTGDLWGACGYHALWNFFQGNIFGLAVSGLDTGDSLFPVTVTGHDDLLTGGEFGLEGSLGATIVLLASLGVLVYLLSRRAPDIPPEESAPTE